MPHGGGAVLSPERQRQLVKREVSAVDGTLLAEIKREAKAYHEAGHALACYVQEVPFRLVT